MKENKKTEFYRCELIELFRMMEDDDLIEYFYAFCKGKAEYEKRNKIFNKERRL